LFILDSRICRPLICGGAFVRHVITPGCEGEPIRFARSPNWCL
jgi:hypothetical protein